MEKYKDQLQKELVLVALKVEDNKVGTLKSFLHKNKLLYRRQHIKYIRNVPNDNKKIIILNKKIKNYENDIPKLIQDYLQTLNISINKIKITIDHNHMSTHEILSKLLPKNIIIPASFESIGHIAHLNLREEHEPYKYIIGDVILAKNSNIKTVITKVGEIKQSFRFYDMQLLAGKSDFKPIVKENNFKYQFDIRKVYWNSRLQNEHKKIVDLFKPSEIICDAFCGVGPFVIPSLYKGCRVFANDLNPECCYSLKNNLKINKIPFNSNITIYNLDARIFIKEIMLRSVNSNFSIDYIIMNLPNSAIEFLDVFKNKEIENKIKTNFLNTNIICYYFSKDKIIKLDIQKKLKNNLGIEIKNYEFRFVRKVSPNKDMICIIFKLKEIKS